LKTIIKLLIAAAILNAVGRCSIAAWHYYQFKDETQLLVTHGGTVPVNTLSNQILDKAMAMALPVLPENVDVQRVDNRTLATVKYSQDVEVFPRYKYPVTFQFAVDAVYVKPTTPDDVTR
jgi:hypothetical protein